MRQSAVGAVASRRIHRADSHSRDPSRVLAMETPKKNAGIKGGQAEDDEESYAPRYPNRGERVRQGENSRADLRRRNDGMRARQLRGSQHGAISGVRDGGRSIRTSSANRIKMTFTQPVWLRRHAGEERVSHTPSMYAVHNILSNILSAIYLAQLLSMLRKEAKKGGWSWGELGAGRWAEDSCVALSVSFLTVWEERSLVSRTQDA